MEFLRPYRKTGELNQIERWKLDRHPLDVADAVIERYAKAGPQAIAAVPGEVRRGSSGSASTRNARAATPS